MSNPFAEREVILVITSKTAGVVIAKPIAKESQAQEFQREFAKVTGPGPVVHHLATTEGVFSVDLCSIGSIFALMPSSIRKDYVDSL